MRIAVFGHKHIFTTEGGIEVVVSELVPLLAKNNTVDVYDRYELDGKTVRRTKYTKPKNMTIKAAPTFKKSAINAQLASLTATVRCMFGRYDIVHVHAEGPCVFLPLLKLAGKKVVVTIHGLDWQRDKWGKFARWYIRLGEKMAAKHADAIIVLSRETQNYFKTTYGRSTVMIRNGVTAVPDYETDALAQFGIQPKKYILFLGRFAPEKRADLLYEAYKKSGTKLKLVFAGPPADLDTSAEWYKKASADPDVVFTGHAEGRVKDQLYSNAALFILPSNLEGMSIALLEALGYGCRVLVSDIPENKDVIHGFGYTFKSGNVNSLAKAIAAAKPNSIRERNTQINYIRVNYDWGHVAEETLRLYKKVLSKKKRR